MLDKLVNHITLTPKNPDPFSNFIVVNRNYVKLHLGNFKTRTRLGEEKMPVFQIDITGELNKLIKEYVKKLGLKNGDHLFFSGTTDHTNEYTEEGFSLALESASKKILGYDLKANNFRHLYVSMILNNQGKYTDAQKLAIANEMGDSSTSMWEKYRNVEEEDETPTPEIEQEEPPQEPPHDEPNDNDVEVETPTPPSDNVGQILDGMYNAMRPFLIQLLSK